MRCAQLKKSGHDTLVKCATKPDALANIDELNDRHAIKTTDPLLA